MCSFGILLGLIFITIYMALIYESTALMLLVYLEAAFFVVSFCYLCFRKFTIKGRIEVPVSISEVGKQNLIKIRIRNRIILPQMKMKACVQVEDTFCGHKEKFWMELSAIPKGESIFTRNLILPTAGNFEISLKKIRIYDMTGLLYMSTAAKSLGRIQIMPKLMEIPIRLTGATRNFYGESDVYDEHCSGHDSSELFQVRSYQKGDRIQNVHWKLTAKQDELMVKEQALPKACPVVIFLEFHPEKMKRKRVLTYFEMAASVSFSLTDVVCPHYVVWFDSQIMDITRVRVDDEESLFYLLHCLLDEKWKTPKEELKSRYDEKYRMEPYLWALSLNEKLEIKKNDETLAIISDKDVESALSKIELLL